MSRIIVRTKAPKAFEKKTTDDLIICRCEEITLGEIRRAIYDGMRTINEVKRFLRAGMGLCQGQTCQRLIQGIIAGETSIPPAELKHIKGRMPVRAVVMEELSRSRAGSK
jgi:NAD(P)H-nitrite reductase large subunit